MITIVDYGMGNMGSICNMFKRIGVSAEVKILNIGGIERSIGKAKRVIDKRQS